jgi:uroporphyrinogen decarboxylase
LRRLPSPFIDDFVEIGVDVLNPVQTCCEGMEPEALKQDFGDRAVFHGGAEKMSGVARDIVAKAVRAIGALKPGGGYVFAPCNHIVDSSPGEIPCNLHQTAVRW